MQVSGANPALVERSKQAGDDAYFLASSSSVLLVFFFFIEIL